MVSMLAKQTKQKSRLALVNRQSYLNAPVSASFTPEGETQLLCPPAMPAALLRLELSLSASVADLQDITDIIRSDIGLTVQLLRLANRESTYSPEIIPSISEIVIEAGVEALRELSARIEALTLDSTDEFDDYERLSLHSRLTALIAEDLAARSPGVDPEAAYLAGLLSHIGDLSSILNPSTASSRATNFLPIGYRIAAAWDLPAPLVEVIGGDRDACGTHESRVLIDIVEAADHWASRLEFLALCEYGASQPSIHPINGLS
ncbi:MAG: HDOD domain-containing protein [Terriglobales bacterium]